MATPWVIKETLRRLLLPSAVYEKLASQRGEDENGKREGKCEKKKMSVVWQKKNPKISYQLYY